MKLTKNFPQKCILKRRENIKLFTRSIIKLQEIFVDIRTLLKIFLKFSQFT